MFKRIKQRLTNLENMLNEVILNYDKLLLEVHSDAYQSYKAQYEANKDVAAKSGYFYLSNKADTALLSKVISEINENKDLTALFRTADGATLSLRVHEQPKRPTRIGDWNASEED